MTDGQLFDYVLEWSHDIWAGLNAAAPFEVVLYGGLMLTLAFAVMHGLSTLFGLGTRVVQHEVKSGKGGKRG